MPAQKREITEDHDQIGGAHTSICAYLRRGVLVHVYTCGTYGHLLTYVVLIYLAR